MNVFRWGGLVVLVVLVGVMPAAAGPPTEQLRQYTDQVLKLLEDPNLQGPDRRVGERKAAIQILDVQLSARRAHGRHGPGRGAADRAGLAHVVADLPQRDVIRQIELYPGGQ